MKRIIATCLVVLFFASCTLLLFTSNSHAWRRSYRHQRQRLLHPKQPAVVWVVPPPPGKSSWCKEHPKKCHARAKHDPKVNTRHEFCIDKHGNGDGYVSAWEGRRFGKECRTD